MDIRKCTRCGSSENIESHHIIFKSQGGSDDKENRKDLCKACHDYEHAKKNVDDYIFFLEVRLESLKESSKKLSHDNKYFKSQKRSISYHKARIKLAKYRLKVLEEFNSVENIIECGYRSYWLDEKTHGPGRHKSKKK